MGKDIVVNRKYMEHVVRLIARHYEIEMDAQFHEKELILSAIEKDGNHISSLHIMDDYVMVNGKLIPYEEIARVIFEADRSWGDYEYGIALKLTDGSVVYSGLIGNYNSDDYIDTYHFARTLHDNHVSNSVYTVLSYNHIRQNR